MTDRHAPVPAAASPAGTPEATTTTVEVAGRPVVDGTSLSIAAGETLALVGESGSGKSSLARAVVGIEKTAAGTVLFRDAPVSPLGIRRRSKALTGIQMVFQDPISSLNPRRTVRDIVAEGLEIQGVEGGRA